MEYNQSTSRAVRLAQIQHFLHKNPNGLTTKEIANLCGVTVRSIQRDLLVLQSDLKVPLNKQNGDRYVIFGSYLLPPVSLSLYEALVVFLASRLALRQADENNPHVQSALTKIASTLPRPLSLQLKQAVRSLDKKAANTRSIHVFEQLAIAWGTRRRTRVRYQSLKSLEPKDWFLDPYFIEMTGAGYSTYVIGNAKSSEREGLMTFKLDRIQEIQPLDEEFEIPDNLDLGTLLQGSWGIIWGEETQVKLKFSSGVARRVKESVWHTSQTVQDLPDGGCILTLTVASTLEITPWIRGWGPDVEVLGPPELRSQFAQWAQELSDLYAKRQRLS